MLQHAKEQGFIRVWAHFWNSRDCLRTSENFWGLLKTHENTRACKIARFYKCLEAYLRCLRISESLLRTFENFWCFLGMPDHAKEQGFIRVWASFGFSWSGLGYPGHRLELPGCNWDYFLRRLDFFGCRFGSRPGNIQETQTPQRMVPTASRKFQTVSRYPQTAPGISPESLSVQNSKVS